MTTTTARQLAEHERRLDQHDDDIRCLYRDVRWLRRALGKIMAHMGIDPPVDEEE